MNRFTVMAEKKPASPVTTSIAVGLVTGLGFSIVGTRLWDELEVSQGLTALVIAAGFVIGAGATYAVLRSKQKS